MPGMHPCGAHVPRSAELLACKRWHASSMPGQALRDPPAQASSPRTCSACSSCRNSPRCLRSSVFLALKNCREGWAAGPGIAPAYDGLWPAGSTGKVTSCCPAGAGGRAAEGGAGGAQAP